MKIVTIIGARPQFVKAAALSRKLVDAGIQEIIIHTGQHYNKNMSEVFFEEMEIPSPKYTLNINQMSHGAMTGKMIEEIESKLILEKPDYVIVYGDTNSTLAGAISAKKIGIKLIHIESGLRSFNMNMPEEINRILTDRISDILFCPTINAIRNLHDEGFKNFDCKIYNSGDIMQDAAQYYEEKSNMESSILNNLHLKNNKYILCTIHRQENINNIKKIESLVKIINNISIEHDVVIPLHPGTYKKIEDKKLEFSENVNIIDPVGYLDMISLLKNSALVMTDSGGLQKEAYFFKKYCLTLREQTEWVELVENGYNVLVGTDKNKILIQLDEFINKNFVNGDDLYGGGNAANRIIDVLNNL